MPENLDYCLYSNDMNKKILCKGCNKLSLSEKGIPQWNTLIMRDSVIAYVNPVMKKSMKGGNYMKAKDYYKKIVETNPQTADEFGAITGEIVSGLNKEAKELIISRKAQRNDAVRGIIRELNNKWNAIVNLYEKDHDFSPFRRNAYWDAWVKQIPELDPNYTENHVLFDYKNPNVLTTLAMLGAAAEGKL